MNGQEIITMANNLLNGENLDEDFALQMLNVVRGYVEMRRPWQVLKKKDTSQTVNGSNTYTNPITMPSDFRRWLGGRTEGTIQLFDGSNYPQTCTEFPYEDILYHKNNAFEFACDYGAKQLYITGIIPGNFTVYQWYIYNPGDIALDTVWLRFPSEFHPLLAYELAAMWRLGTDYDDVNARNADDNARRADMIYKSMEKWDAALAGSQIKHIDYPQNKQGRNLDEGRWGPRGTKLN